MCFSSRAAFLEEAESEFCPVLLSSMVQGAHGGCSFLIVTHSQ